MPNYLSHDEIHELEQAILEAEMNTTTVRYFLLQNIHRGYVAGLPIRDGDYYQIASDLNKLNGRPFLIGDDPDTYEVPLRIWLSNGVTILRNENKPQKRIFQRALDKVAAKSEAIILADKGEISAPAPEVPELIIHEDDLLAYSWLRGAISVGDSVVRLTVPRYHNGQSQNKPGTDDPIMIFGTGWLIGKQYIITNHHVVNARSETEPYATDADLHKQAENTRVEFNYDNNNAEGEQIGVESLETWWPWNENPKLDYAILKLRDPSPCEALTLSPKALDELADVLQSPGLYKPAVNIVQHPGGKTKMLGIRNNVVSAISDTNVEYFTDTERGSSGSPVCNDNWEVVALHRGSGKLGQNVNFQGKPTGYVNRGVRIDLIIMDLQDNHADLWQEIDANVN